MSDSSADSTPRQDEARSEMEAVEALLAVICH